MTATAQWRPDDAARCVRAPRASDDKYARGVLGVRTGSTAYPGAAALGVEAAWRTGLGMVRYVGPDAAATLVLHRRPETVLGTGRVQAWLIGSGTDAASREPAEAAALRGILCGDVPVVADAGALDLVSGATAPLLVTPHAAEHARLRERLGLSAVDGSDGSRAAASALETAAALGAAVLLKGAVTVVATPGGWCRTVTAPTAWLATAGTGDVLGGAVGALVASAAAGGAQDVEALGPLAATGALVHGRAAQLASEAAGGGPVTALDIAEALPRAVGELLARGADGAGT